MRLHLAVVILLSTVACATIGTKAPDAPTPDTDAILQVIGRFSAAHACPVGEHLALTSAHVPDIRPFEEAVPLFPYQWGSGEVAEGILIPVNVWAWRDLGLMKSETAFPRWYAIASERPHVSDKLWLVEYDFHDASHAYAERRLEVKVTRVVARNVHYVEGGRAGSSGSCLLNAAGEVVAVNSWRVEPESGTGQASGVAVGVWGEKFELPVPEVTVLEGAAP